MGFLDKLRGKKPAIPPRSEPPPMIDLIDGNGRPVRMLREEWRTTVLPGMFRDRWSDADALADLVAMSLRDGFAADVVEPARRLVQIDRTPRRGATLLAVAMIENGRLDEAERLVQETRSRDGDDSALLANLARISALRGRTDESESFLWRSLELDPNYEPSFGGWLEAARTKGADESASLRRIAALPASWRAQIWLARAALASGDPPAAMTLYREALSRVDPVPPDALMQISGDLGNAGRLREALDLCEPRFDPGLHGIMAGNNLIKMHVELGDAPGARRLLDLLFAQKRIDWRETLTYWDVAVHKLEVNYGPVAGGKPLEIGFLDIAAPIWAPEGTPLVGVTPRKPDDAPRIAFVAGSATGPSAGTAVVAQPTDELGRFTRGLPLLLASEVQIRTAVRATSLIPWIRTGGFVLSGAPWPFETVGPHAGGVGHLVFLHVDAKAIPWKAELRLVRVFDENEIARCSAAVDPADAGLAIEALADGCLESLRVAGLAEFVLPPGRFALPETAWIPGYLAAMEQALAVRGARAVTERPFLQAERSILDHQLDLCLSNPVNVPARFLLLATLRWEGERRPDIAAEYRERVERLQRDHPLPGADRFVSDEMKSRIYSGASPG